VCKNRKVCKKRQKERSSKIEKKVQKWSENGAKHLKKGAKMEKKVAKNLKMEGRVQKWTKNVYAKYFRNFRWQKFSASWK
jgi:hypothetical protein